MNKRPHGFGTLVSKGEGKPYLARWMYKGQIFTKSTGQVDKKKALKELERLTRPFRERYEIECLKEIELKIKSKFQNLEFGNVKISEIQAEYEKTLAAKDLAESSLNLYRNYMKPLVEFFKDKKFMRDLTVFDAQEFLEASAKEISPDTWNLRLSYYKKVWKELYAKQFVDKNIFESFKKRRIQKFKEKNRALSSDEVAKLVAQASDNRDLLLLVLIAVYTGMRVSDCANLRWSQIDMKKKLIKVIPIKTKNSTKQPIEIPIHDVLFNELKKRNQDNEYVSAKNMTEYANGKLSHKTKQLFIKSGIPTLSFHSLRHTFVSMSINSGLPLPTVQAIAGHSSTSMTEKYFHSNEQVMRDGISKIDNFIALAS